MTARFDFLTFCCSLSFDWNSQPDARNVARRRKAHIAERSGAELMSSPTPDDLTLCSMDLLKHGPMDLLRKSNDSICAQFMQVLGTMSDT